MDELPEFLQRRRVRAAARQREQLLEALDQ